MSDRLLKDSHPRGSSQTLRETQSPATSAAPHTALVASGSDAPRYTINAIGIRLRAWSSALGYKNPPRSPFEATMNVSIDHGVQRLGAILDQSWTVNS